MPNYRSEQLAARNRGWFALAGVGVGAALYVAWSRRQSYRRESLAVRERARLVPVQQARTEADWVRQAVSYAGGAKGG